MGRKTMRGLRLFLAVVAAVGLLGFMGENSVLVADENDPPHLTHISDARGPGLGTDCEECHTSLPADYTNAPQSACVGCHGQGGPYDGVFGGTIGAVNNWQNTGSSAGATQSLVYNSDGTLKPGKEKWCASCHDQDPTGVLIDNFEGYTDDSELRAEWLARQDARQPFLMMNDGPDGSQSMLVRLVWDLKANRSAGFVKKSFSPSIDLTGTDAIRLYVKVNNKSRIKNIRVKLIKEEGGVAVARILKRALKNDQWQRITLNRVDFNDTSYGKVTGIQIFVREKDPLQDYKVTVSVDNIQALNLAGNWGPNVIGDDTTYGFYVSGHGTFVNCLTCHDSESDHLDDEQRPVFDYIRDRANPTGFRFYVSDPTMNLQLPYTEYIPGNTGSFALCYQCHDEACITQDAPATSLNTNFTDTNWIAAGPPNLHLLHVGGPALGNLEPQIFHGTCVLCHDVMAPRKPAMTRREMGNFIYFDDNGCEVPSELWHDAAENKGGAQTEGIFTYFPNLCIVCHLDGVPPNPDCSGSNPYVTPSGMDGWYNRTFKDACVLAVGTGHTTHLTDSKGPQLGEDCYVCHDDGGNFSLFADGQSLSSTTACDSCHSPRGAFDGVNSSAGSVGAKENWDDGVYESDRMTLQSGKEKWCVGCHDDAPAFSKQTPVEVIVDNQDAGASFTGTWGTSSFAPGYYGADYHYHLAGSGTDTFTWVPTLPSSGTYTVYVRWTQDPSRSPNATYTIYHDGGSTVAVVDQRSNGGTWVPIGTFDFDGSGDYVELLQSTDGYVIADAIKWESGPPGTFAPNVAGDNSTFGFYVTGHNTNCLACHHAASDHIDGVHRTYDAGVTEYTASYRLMQVYGQAAMILPRPLHPINTNPILHPEDFALCFKCHDKNEVLSANPSAVGATNFWNSDASPQNSHNIHLGIYTNHADSDWDGVADSAESCISCHNVHGAPNQAMVRHGELINKAPALNFAYLVGTAPGTRDTSALLGASIGGNINYAGSFISQNGVCDACHGAISYLRTPNMVARVLTPEANPSEVNTSGDVAARTVVLSVSVLDYDTDVTGVTVNLSPIGGGSAVAMSPSGGWTNNLIVYTYTYVVPTSADPGQKQLLVTASDGSGSGQANILLNVVKPGVEIVDNIDSGASFSGAWTTNTFAPGYYGPNYHYHLAGAGSDIFTWTPVLATAGSYKVYARWTQDPSRATDATYTVYHNGGSTPVVLDQRSNGGVWYLLGTFSLDGIGDKVDLGQRASGIVVADAIKFELQ